MSVSAVFHEAGEKDGSHMHGLRLQMKAPDQFLIEHLPLK